MIRYYQRALSQHLFPIKKEYGKYFFSKKLKRKLEEEIKKQQIQSKKLVKEEVQQQKSFVDRKKIRLQQQFFPSTLFLVASFTQYQNPLEDFFLYSVFGLEKSITLVLLGNLTFSKNKYIMYLLTGAAVGLQLLPTMHLATLVSPFIQIVLLMTINRPILKEEQAGEEQKQSQIYEIKLKLLIFFFLVSTLIMKGYHYQEEIKIKQLIERINNENQKIINTDQVSLTSLKQKVTDSDKKTQWSKSEFVS